MHSLLGTGGAIAMRLPGVVSQLKPPVPTSHPTKAAGLQEDQQSLQGLLQKLMVVFYFGCKGILNGPVKGLFTDIVVASAPKRMTYAIFTPAW